MPGALRSQERQRLRDVRGRTLTGARFHEWAKSDNGLQRYEEGSRFVAKLNSPDAKNGTSTYSIAKVHYALHLMCQMHQFGIPGKRKNDWPPSAFSHPTLLSATSCNNTLPSDA